MGDKYKNNVLAEISQLDKHDAETLPLSHREEYAKRNALLDKAIVSRVLQGDKKAFDLLVIKYQQRIAHVVYPYIKDSEEVYDVVQEIFIKVYRNMALFKGESAFYSWLYRIAINTSKNYLSSIKRRPPRQDVDFSEAHYLDEESMTNHHSSPDKILEYKRLSKTIDKLILALPNELQQVIILKESYGLSYEQIAEKVNCPIGTVRSRIYRAREILSEKISPLL